LKQLGFYSDLNESLTKQNEFKRNRYDPCICNKRTKDGAMAIQAQVDNLKVFPKSSKQLASKQLEKIIQDLRDFYGEIMAHRGSIKEYNNTSRR
jgi:hypothetical protein